MRRVVHIILVLLFSLTGWLNAPSALAGPNERRAPSPSTKTGATAKVKQNKGSGSAKATAKVKKPSATPQAERPLAGHLTARSAIVLDAQSGVPLLRLADETPRQPASTIKILTGHIALKALRQEEQVQVSRRASDMPRSKVDLVAGRAYRADDLINAVLLASANDASVALAEKIAGSEENFAHMMTTRATLWGAKQTVCKTANGLTAPGQQTTARDLAVIFRHLMRDPDFARRMGQVTARTRDGITLKNHNKALWNIEGAVGGKTGYTAAAGKTYVGQFERNGAKIIIALMGSDNMWQDITLLVERGFQLHQQHHDLANSRAAAARSFN